MSFSFLADGAAAHSDINLVETAPKMSPREVGDEKSGEGKPGQGGGEEEAAGPEATPEATPEAKPAERSGDPVFFLSAESFDLQPEETQELVISAYPDANGLFEEQLVCTVTDNPQPVVFRLSAIGSAAAVTVDTTSVEFERLLLKRTDTKCVRLSSESALPVRWEVSAESLAALTGDANEAGCEDFTIEPTSGTIAPGASCDVQVTFHAREAKEVEQTLAIEVMDAAAELGAVQRHSVHVSAEAYAIDVDIAWPDDQFEGLDFGAFKVADKQESALELVNGGKYDVGYKVLCRKQPLRDILAISPSEGVLAPGGERQRVEFTLQATEELTLLRNSDMRIQFTELSTGEMLLRTAAPEITRDYPRLPEIRRDAQVARRASQGQRAGALLAVRGGAARDQLWAADVWRGEGAHTRALQHGRVRVCILLAC